jgi:small-conductance mechanosensitive channel
LKIGAVKATFTATSPQVKRMSPERRHSGAARQFGGASLTGFLSRVLLARLFAAFIFVGAAPAVAKPVKPEIAQAVQLAQAANSGTPAENAPPADPGASLDAVKQSLDKIDAQLAEESMTDGELVKLRAALDPLSAQIQAVISDTSPKLTAVKARLEQLGQPPDLKVNPNAAPEDPAVTQERADQQKLFAANDDLIKRANVAQLRVDQTATQIADRRRTMFANAVFQSSSSILSPSLWMDAARAAPNGAAAAKNAFADLARRIGAAFADGSAVPFSLALAAALGAAIVLSLAARRTFPRRKSGPAPSELQKAAAAFWNTAMVTTIPIATLFAIDRLAEWFGFDSNEFKPISNAFFLVVVRFSWAIGLGNAILAPRRPLWRPVDLTDRVARRLMNLILVLTGVISLGDLFEAFDEVVSAPLAVSVATKGLFSLIVGVLLIRGLYGIVAPPEGERESASGHPANLENESAWWPTIRFAAWASTIAVIGADLVGFIALSSFLVRQIAWTAFVVGLLFLLLKLISEAFEKGFHPSARLSRGLVASVGLRRESVAQIGVLLSGLLTLVLYAFAALMIVAPWGLQSHDMFGAIRSAFFGFKLGDVTISPWGLLSAMILFGVGYTVTHAIQGWLEKRYLPLTQIDQGLKASIRTSVGYIGFLLSLLFAVAYLGIDLEKLALVVSALSVGIGLGLQSVVNNFVSGLILLWERAIRVGDLVTIGSDQGYVRRISVRATEIQTFDRATMIVPNGNIMTGVVKNFVRGDRVGRVKIPLRVVWGADPQKVRETLLDVAKSHDEVVGIPAATVLFTSAGGGWLDFDLICFVEDVERSVRVQSDLLFAIFSRFAEEGINLTATAPATTNVTFDTSQIEPLFQRYIGAREDMKT